MAGGGCRPVGIAGSRGGGGEGRMRCPSSCHPHSLRTDWPGAAGTLWRPGGGDVSSLVNPTTSLVLKLRRLSLRFWSVEWSLRYTTLPSYIKLCPKRPSSVLG